MYNVYSGRGPGSEAKIYAQHVMCIYPCNSVHVPLFTMYENVCML